MRGLWNTVFVVLLSASCQPAAPEAPAAERAQAQIDAGNAAFSAGDFASAARRYAGAVAQDPEDPAAYYGLGMALAKLGRDEESRTAYARARELQRRASAPPAH